VSDLLRGAGTAAQPPRGGWLDQHRSPAAMLCTTTQGVGLCEWDGQLGAASPVSFPNDTLLVLISDEVIVGCSLLKLWQHQRLACEGEATMLLSMWIHLEICRR